MAKRGRIWLGTSGWQYDHWVGPVYEPDLEPGARLASYARSLDSVEINSTFYGLPSVSSTSGWRDSTPENFVFAVKASRYITHMKKLNDPAESISRFFRAIEPLEDKLGPILFQLPPRWRVNVKRLDSFLSALPSDRRYAFELRDESWQCPETLALLARHNAAFCIFDLAGHQTAFEITADFAYIRLHGPDGAYRGSYSERALAEWSRRIDEWRNSGRDCYCYFDNDEGGYAFENAVRLKDILVRP